jgi:hypothetical protein
MLHTGLPGAAHHSFVFLSRRLVRQGFPFNISVPVAVSPFTITLSVISCNAFLMFQSFHAFAKSKLLLSTNGYDFFLVAEFSQRFVVNRSSSNDVNVQYSYKVIM